MSAVLSWLIQGLAGVLAVAMAVVSLLERKPIWAMAKQTWREAVRKKAFWLVMLFALIILAATVFLRAAGSEAAREERRLRIMVEVSFRTMSLFSVLAAIFLTSLSLPSDISDRQIFTLLSKPLSRWGLIAGKILGFCLVTFTMLFLMAAVTLVLLEKTAASAPPEARENILAAREIIRPGEVLLLAWRKPALEGNRILLPMRPQIPPGSLFRFEAPELAGLSGQKEVLAQFRFHHFRDENNRIPYTPDELRDCSVEFELIDPATRRAQFRRAPIQPENGLSKPFPVPGDFLATGSLGVRVVRLEPPPQVEGPISFLRSAETARWVFRGLDRSDLTSLPPAGNAASTAAGTVLSPRPAALDQQVTARVRLRAVSRQGFYSGSRPVELRIGYRWPEDVQPRGHVTITVLDGRAATFGLPPEAVSNRGDLVLDLEMPLDAPFYPGYDNQDYGITLLSAPRSFEFNVLKAILMVSMQVILLIAVTAAASTFLSWPVTALTALFVYASGSFVPFFGDLIESVEKSGLHGMGSHSHGPVEEHHMSWMDHIVKGVLEALRIVLPDLSRFSPLNFLGQGYSVSVAELMHAFAYLCIFATFSLAAGWLIFRRRSVE
ncbi:MAG: ABC transporter permease [Planctomycetes bacterium]|nr:ABC transporter permease [Planctomycetota bacterium]